MRVFAALVVLAAAPAALAGDRDAPGHNGLTIGHDGKAWRMEGCAAYPVEANATPEKTERTVTAPEPADADATPRVAGNDTAGTN